MARGYTTTIRAQQGSDRPEPTWRRLIGRNASAEDEVQARKKLVGLVFTADGGRKYRIVKVYRNELNRLIVAGIFIEEEHSMTIDELVKLRNKTEEPVTVTHCGSSSKCQGRFQEMRLKDTIDNKRVFSIGCDTKSDGDLQAMGEQIDKVGLDILHLWKIDASSEVLILDITDDGQHYIGESAARELEYTRRMGKRIRFYSQEQH